MANFKRTFLDEAIFTHETNKKGIKLWVGSDSSTRYIYDLNVYAGMDTEQRELGRCGLIRFKMTKLFFAATDSSLLSYRWILFPLQL